MVGGVCNAIVPGTGHVRTDGRIRRTSSGRRILPEGKPGTATRMGRRNPGVQRRGECGARIGQTRERGIGTRRLRSSAGRIPRSASRTIANPIRISVGLPGCRIPVAPAYQTALYRRIVAAASSEASIIPAQSVDEIIRAIWVGLVANILGVKRRIP